ncbi:MAG TPA: hypothetical protein VG939_18465 [Caulobacteraceae bacterium]|nr:hypothetical protein [Caulobacteraceae bacterium]
MRGTRLIVAAIVAAMAPAAALAQDGVPNTFISPMGEPFRAGPADPYPVAAWFNRADANHDGKLDHAEFLADAEAFFKVLDRNSDGLISPFEVSVYEHLMAPEILAGSASADATRPGGPAGGALILAQYGGPGGGQMQGAPGGIDPSGEQPPEPTVRPPGDRYGGVGASPYSLLPVPEPVTSTDPDFMFRGRVSKARFLAAADQRFSALDEDGAGYLTLAKLPKTAVEVLVEQAQKKRRGRR